MASEASTNTDAPHRPPPASPTTIYRSLRDYPFDQDREYLSGLSAILGHPETLPTQEELASNPDLILQARCFYFARRNSLPPINPFEYKEWLAQNTTSTGPSIAAAPQSLATSQSTDPTTTTAAQQPPPPYPTSFAAIVDLITRNVPVPGIEEIPTTVLEHGSSKIDHTPRRRKPWETNAEEASLPILPVVVDEHTQPSTHTSGAASATVPAASVTEGGSDAAASVKNMEASAGAEGEKATTGVNGHLMTGEGVVKILQEGAVPDSGLLARE